MITNFDCGWFGKAHKPASKCQEGTCPAWNSPLQNPKPRPLDPPCQRRADQGAAFPSFGTRRATARPYGWTFGIVNRYPAHLNQTLTLSDHSEYGFSNIPAFQR